MLQNLNKIAASFFIFIRGHVFALFPVGFFLRPYRALFMGGDLFPGLKPRAGLRRPCGTLTIAFVFTGACRRSTTKPQRGTGTQPRVSTRGITYAIENTSPKGAQENNLNSSVFALFPVVFFLRGCCKSTMDFFIVSAQKMKKVW